MTWVTPVSHDESIMFNATALLDAPKLMRIVRRLSPRWYEHTQVNLVLDGDSVILQRQQHNLQMKSRDGYGGAWKKEFTLASSTNDVLMVQFRQWLDARANTMPFARSLSTDAPPDWIPRRIMNDRYEFHTKDCSSCTGALRNIKVGILVALVGIGIAASIALFAGLGYAALLRSGVPFAARPLKNCAIGGVVGWWGALCWRFWRRSSKTGNAF